MWEEGGRPRRTASNARARERREESISLPEGLTGELNDARQALLQQEE
jgi:hypothetical protein